MSEEKPPVEISGFYVCPNCGDSVLTTGNKCAKCKRDVLPPPKDWKAFGVSVTIRKEDRDVITAWAKHEKERIDKLIGEGFEIIMGSYK